MTKVQWYHRENNEVEGPFSADEIRVLYENAKIDNFTYVFDDQTEEWGMMNEKAVLLEPQTLKIPTSNPLNIEKNQDETGPETLWQKFQKWNDLDSVPETSLWHKNWYWIALIVGIVILRAFFKS